jgi:hypothetical protein
MAIISCSNLSLEHTRGLHSGFIVASGNPIFASEQNTTRKFGGDLVQMPMLVLVKMDV